MEATLGQSFGISKGIRREKVIQIPQLQYTKTKPFEAEPLGEGHCLRITCYRRPRTKGLSCIKEMADQTRLCSRSNMDERVTIGKTPVVVLEKLKPTKAPVWN